MSFYLRLTAPFAASAALLLVSGGVAHAQATLGNSGSVTPTPVTGFFGGTLLSSASATFFGQTANGSGGFNTISGALRSAVFSGGTGATGLDFYFQLVTDGNTNTDVETLSVGGFRLTSVAVANTNSDIDGTGAFTAGGVASDSASRSSNGNAVTFTLPAGFTSNTSTYAFLVRTNATNYTNNGGAGVGGGAVTANTVGQFINVAPAAAPEPGSLALLGTGALGVLGMVARRRKTA